MTENLERQLQDAAANGDLSRCMRLLATGAVASTGGSWALVRAAEAGHIEVCRLLLEHGAKADARESLALRLVSVKSDLDVCCLLLEHGAEVDADGNWAMAQALHRGNLDVVRLLLGRGAMAGDIPEEQRAWALANIEAAGADVAAAIFPDRDREWIAAAAVRAGNQPLSDALTAESAREGTSPRLCRREAMRP